MNLIMIECGKCKTKFLTIVKCSKVTRPDCGNADEIIEIKLDCSGNDEK
jgi:hypothetical protein